MNRRIKRLAAAMCGLLTLAGAAFAQTWTGAAGGDWFNDLNWSPSGVPGAGATVTVNAGSVLLTNATAELSSFTMAGGTLTFSNWNTCLSADAVTLSGGTVTLPPSFTNSQMSNRVWFACTDFTLGSSGTINGVGKGYRGGGIDTARHGQGPGGGPGGDVRQGASHGGQGNRIANTLFLSDGLPYETAEWPLAPGSGGGGYNYNDTEIGGNGGSAVLIEATDGVVIDGSILADATSGGGNSGGGSGGGVLVRCRTITGVGIVSASGANTGRPATSGNGGGGRIAVHYDSGAQAALAPPEITFRARGGTAGTYPAQWGSLWFSGTHLLKPVISHLDGYLYCGASTSWETDSLTVTNGIRLTLSTNFAVTVTNNLRIGGNSLLTFGHGFDAGTTGGLTVNGGVTLNQGQLHYYFAEDLPGSLAVGGNLALTNGAALYLYAGPTNAASAVAYGGSLTLLERQIVVPAGCAIYVRGHPVNCAGIFLRTGSLTVAAGGAVNADGRGGRGGIGATDAEKSGCGIGAGIGSAAGQSGGGGYGGCGGGNGGGYPYGDPVGPMHVGSGGGSYPYGTTVRAGAGGGLVHIEATGAIVVEGLITACGLLGESNTSGGSGGGVLLVCKALHGNGVIRADGGNAGRNIYGDGGGGRVAVWTGQRVTAETPPARIIVSEIPPTTFTGAYPTVAPGSANSAIPAESGTVRFVEVYAPGGTILLLR